MKKITSVLLMIVFVLGMALTGCSNAQGGAKTAQGDTTKQDSQSKNAKLKVGFIYVGPTNDGGYTYAHDQGRLAMVKATGVETIFKENVKEDKAEVVKVAEDMINQGCNVIIGTSYGFMDGIEEVAKKHKDVKFLHCSGYKSAENMGNYFGRMEQARYLSGIVAGLKTKSNKIGFVGAMNLPEVVRGINAFTLGVQSVNKDAVVKVKWTNTWFDPAKEKEAAKALLDEGADVLAQHQDSTATQQAAEERGAFSIGYDTDTRDKAPKSYMTAPVWDWGAYYTEVVKQMQAGTWKSDSYYKGMESGIVKLADLTSIAPAEAKDKVEKAKADIISGKFNVFQGPIKDQTGAVKVPEGKTMTDEEILSFDWFVQGVEGKVK